jgi:8-oxo-dGTP pyrophosphatase MutT (NUDIX family)
MAPRPRREWPEGHDPTDVRPAAGLLLVFPVADRPHVVLTVRADTLGRHGGQVSLPGGVVEEGEAVAEAALREAREEVALSTHEVRLLGHLTPLDIPVSGFRLHPVVGAVERRQPLRPADREVARILEIPVDTLMDPARQTDVEFRRGDLLVAAPAFMVEDVRIWGATAMVLSEFLAVLGWTGPPRPGRSGGM